MSNLEPSNNTACVMVTGCAQESTVGRSGVVRIQLQHAATSYSGGLASTLVQNSINLSSLAPSKLQACLCGAVNTEARGMWAMVAGDSNLADNQLLAFLPSTGTLSISIAGRSTIRTQTPGYTIDAPAYVDVISGAESPCAGVIGSHGFGAPGKVNGSQITLEAMQNNTWTKYYSDTGTALTSQSLKHGGATPNFMVLGSGMFKTSQASSTAYTTWLSKPVDVPLPYDVLGLNSYGWKSLSLCFVYRTFAPVDIVEATLMISPRWHASAVIPRQPVHASTLASGGVQLVANVQPLTVSMSPSSPPITIAAGGTPLATIVSNTVDTNVINAPTVSLSTSAVVPVCGAPHPHPRVAVTGVQISELGVEVDRPLTVTNRPHCREVVLTTEYLIPTQASAPMVVTSDIPRTDGTSDDVLGDLVARPLRISSNAVNVAPAPGAIFQVTQPSGTVFDIRAGADQGLPLWTSDIDPDV